MSQGCHGDHGSECVLHASEQTILRVLMLTVIIAEKTNIFETIHFYKVVFFFQFRTRKGITNDYVSKCM